MELKFKTNLKCNGCIESIRPNLESIQGITDWSVDLNSPDRVLVVKGESLDEPLIISALTSAGYKAEKVI